MASAISRTYANSIEDGRYDYNSTKKAYVKIKDEVTKLMHDDVYTGWKQMTPVKFEKITGIVWVDDRSEEEIMRNPFVASLETE